VYTIEGVHLEDSKDRDVDRVRVDIWATNGTLSLPTDALELADFSDCSIRRYSEWRCRGRGSRDQNMTFVATPSDVNLLLERITYQPYYKNIADTITVRVHDGMDHDCLHSLEHRMNGNEVLSLHNGCYTVDTTIAVWTPMQLGLDDNDTNLNVPKIFGIPISAIVFWGLVGGVLFAVAFCLAKCCKMLCCCCSNKRGTRQLNQQVASSYSDFV